MTPKGESPDNDKATPMASTIPSTDTNCCSTCTDPTLVNVPGTAGSNGAAGANGSNGINAFSTIVGATLVPAFGASETVELLGPSGSLWMGQGQTVYVQSYGYFRVDGIPDNTHATLFNLGYAGNVDGDSIITFAAGARVQPGGIEGPGSGGGSGDAFLIANNLSEGDPTTMRSNLGLGTAATAAAGDFFAVANNLSEGNHATQRTNLGLGTSAVKDTGIASGKLALNDGALTPGDACFATANGIETKTAANARLALGIGGQAGNYILIQERIASGGTESAFNTGADIPVPITDLVVNEGGVASIDVPNKRITLPVGRYRVRASIPGAKCDNFQVWIYNFTNNTVDLVGSSARSDATDATTSYSLINGILEVIGMSKVYGLIARSTATGTFGVGVSFGQTFVTTSWELEQES